MSEECTSSIFRVEEYAKTRNEQEAVALLIASTQHHISEDSIVSVIIIILSSTLRPPKLFLPSYLPPPSDLRIWCYKHIPVLRNFKTHLSTCFWVFPHFSVPCDCISVLTLVIYHFYCIYMMYPI
jgi:hypothetical protein